MANMLGAAGLNRLHSYFDRIGLVLRNKKRRASFAMYGIGLLSDGDRKSVEPIAARMCGDAEKCRAVTEQLLHFVGDSKWDDAAVRAEAALYALEAMTTHGVVEAWILDDTGFLKQGDKSPGVQRQYTGSAGKTTNCQLGVSLTLCTRTVELPVDMDLYLPTIWTEDRERCRASRIPDEVGYRAKWQIALDLVKRAVAAGYPPGVVLGDSAYGDVGPFRDGLRELDLEYALDIKKHTRVRIVCDDGSVTDVMSVEQAAEAAGTRSYRRVTWRQGTKRDLTSLFAFLRVRVARGRHDEEQEQWLCIERPTRDEPVEHYVLSTLGRAISHKQLVRRIKQRWRIERTYEDMKGEIGLDHFEGRSYPGWQHHISCVLACFAFVVAERSRAFPPEAGRSEDDDAIVSAA